MLLERDFRLKGFTSFKLFPLSKNLWFDGNKVHFYLSWQRIFYTIDFTILKYTICILYIFYIYFYTICILYIFYIYFYTICILYIFYIYFYTICILYIFYIYFYTICILYIFYIYFYTICHHHHHHIVLAARISLTLSRHSSLSFIALGRSSGQHPVSSHSCWMYVRAGRPAFARPCVGIHKSTSLMSSSLLLQQCPACLVLLTW